MIIRKHLGVDVVHAARERIKKIFKNNLPVLVSFSGGKDSIVLADIVYKLAISGQIDKSLIEVVFIDEEAVYDEVIELTKKWRKKFMSAGIKFTWYCIEVKHFNALNTLADEESFICWDRFKKDDWIRPMPDFAVKDHPLLIPRKDNYQSFMGRVNEIEGSLSIMGTRAAESVQRLTNFAKQITPFARDVRTSPIYDMTDKDVWKYIKDNNLEIPNVYENLYRIGTGKNQLRMSQFFSIDTVKSLTKLDEIYPNLMNRIKKREPNAYIVQLYWDSEMFGRSSRRRRKNEALQKGEQKNYRNEVFKLINNPDLLESDDKKKLASQFKALIVRFGTLWDEKAYKKAYEIMMTGDPKRRSYRAFFTSLFSKAGGGFKKK